MEVVDLYNNKREKIGLRINRDDIKKGQYRLSVHVWIVNDDKLLIQKRTESKKIFPNLWEQSGGGVLSGETSKEAAIREVKEELGLEIIDEEIAFIGSYTRVNDIVDIWVVEKKINEEGIIIQKDEVEDYKFIGFEEFDNMITNNEVVPTINPSYQLLKNFFYLYKKGKSFAN